MTNLLREWKSALGLPVDMVSEPVSVEGSPRLDSAVMKSRHDPEAIVAAQCIISKARDRQKPTLARAFGRVQSSANGRHTSDKD